jgi:hypothetical protein
MSQAALLLPNQEIPGAYIGYNSGYPEGSCQALVPFSEASIF